MIGDEAFLGDSVSVMASSARVEFSAKLRTAVVAKTSALLTSVSRTSMNAPELLSVLQAWSKMDHSSWQGQPRAAPTIDLVTALRLAHDVAQALCCGQVHRRHRRSSTERRSGASTTVIGAPTAVGMMAPGVVAPGEAATWW